MEAKKRIWRQKMEVMELRKGDHGGRERAWHKKRRPCRQHGDLGGRERRAWSQKKEHMEVGKGDHGGSKKRPQR